jgi:hypothetical protein
MTDIETKQPGVVAQGSRTPSEQYQEAVERVNKSTDREIWTDSPPSPTTGPCVGSGLPRAPMPEWQQRQFERLLDKLSQWRGDDHEDAITLRRSEIIAILEGVKACRNVGLASAPAAPTPPSSEPVAWRYKCEDGGYVLLVERLTDAQKARGYYTGDEGEDEVEGNEAVIGPFYWSEETALYAHPQIAGAGEREEFKVTLCDDGAWMVHTEGDIICYAGQGNEEQKAHRIAAVLNAPHSPVRSGGLDIPDDELAAWARNWHWNDCAEDKPVDPSIYFRDMRMLKAFILKARAALKQGAGE